ncbi:hypothetical protein FUA24_16550 [Seonamhaeicola marinus]|uniref:Uncharacterized protein n=2 Tax=Seonamhaeicola marinus TaxID=1912246 RepID=A0A5D0HUR8_9FLAO|nr:hypothetical protein FUA24_16550 [Seonamhaeicola marinus]
MTTNNINKKPSFHAFYVQGEKEETTWTKVGVAWNHKDEKGFNLVLDVLPINFDGEIVLREPKD